MRKTSRNSAFNTNKTSISLTNKVKGNQMELITDIVGDLCAVVIHAFLLGLSNGYALIIPRVFNLK